MSREREYKRRSPSVIARLMGFEGVPSQQPAKKQQKKSSHILLESPYSDRSMGKISKEQQDVKDVFEVPLPVKAGNRSYSPQHRETSEFSGAKLAFVQQKFIDIKRLSSSEKLQKSKEFTDALEVLDSNTDLFLKFIQEPDSLFSKHIHDLRRNPLQSECSYASTGKAGGASSCRSQDTVLKSKKDLPFRSKSRFTLDSQDNFCIHSQPPAAHHDHKSSKSLSRGKDESYNLPTRIVVLKPNLGRAQGVAKPVSCPQSPHAYLPDYCDLQKDMVNVKSRKVEPGGEGNIYDDEDLLRYNSGETREIAKRITRRMRGSMSTGSLDFSPCGYRGYAGDESSCYVSGIESAVESDIALTSRKSFDLSSRHRPSSYHSPGLSVNKEAKKRLSERWKMTQKFQEVGLGQSSTLGEMLAISDREVRSENSGSIADKARKRDEKWSGNGERIRPLGISSKDGWKDGCIKKLPKSSSLPTSSDAFGNSAISMRHETVDDDWCLMPNETMKKRNKGMKGKNDLGESLVNRSSKSSSKHSRTRSISRENWDAVSDTYIFQNQVKSCHEDESPCEQKCVISEVPLFGSMENLVHDEVSGLQDESLPAPSKVSKTLVCELPALECNSSSNESNVTLSQDTSNGQSEEDLSPLTGPIVEPESPTSFKEAEQPSPVSILEVPFKDDLSSTVECFGSLSADLQGLRMQLHLLKLESGGLTESAVNVAGGDDIEEDTMGVLKEKELVIAEDSLKYSYAIDILAHSGFKDADPEMFVSAWHSTDLPVDPLLFKELENKYDEEHSSWSKSERKLLFDELNSGLVEIFRPFTNPHPWVKPADRWVKSKRSKDDLESDLFKLLCERREGRRGGIMEMDDGLMKESEWSGLGDEMDEIGREIQGLLMDDLMAELILVY